MSPCFAIMMALNSTPNVYLIYSLINTKHTTNIQPNIFLLQIYFIITDSSSFKSVFQMTLLEDRIVLNLVFLSCSTIDSVYEGLED